jgi:GntR family transcriptional regulator / MocR family aminotransferase
MASPITGPELLLELGAGPGGLRERLEGALRSAIRGGRLRPGDRLPATRSLAAELGCSRWVVVEAYDQLAAEGWIEGRPGSGTRVRARPDAGNGGAAAAAEEAPRRAASSFALGLPDLVAFPRAAWLRAVQRAVRTAPPSELGHVDPAGVPALRAELAAYVSRVRGVVTDPADVVVTHGFTHGFGMVCHALRDEGHTSIALEDPGFPLLPNFARRAGLEPVSVPLDAGGLRLDALAASGARAVVVAPAHHFPAGAVLAAERRAALLAWARAVDGLVIEDDYDAEFRYDRRPVGALQGLDPERVAYAGSASKSLAPALRIGWLALPPPWRRRVARVRWGVDLGVGALDQLALAELLRTGALDRHLRRTRQAYAAKRRVLLDALARELPGARVAGVAAGLHALVLLPDGTDEAAVVAAAAERDVEVVGLSAFYRRATPPGPGLVLGYATLSEHAIAEGVRRLGQASASQESDFAIATARR